MSKFVRVRDYLLEVFNEASTWRALLRLLVAAGLIKGAVDVESAVTMVLVLTGIIGLLFRDNIK